MAGMVDKLVVPSAGTLILVDSAARTSSGDSGAITGLDAVTPLKAQLHVTEVSGMTLGVNPETKKEEEVGPPVLIVVVEETLDGTNWNGIGDRGRFPLIDAVRSHTISLGDPLADAIRFTWTIRGRRVRNVETGEPEPGKLVSPLFRFSVTSPACWSDAAPYVTSTVPTTDATGVAPTTDVTAAFSEVLLGSSINARTFQLFERDSTTELAATVSYDAATSTAKLNPDQDLQRGVTYKAVVTTGAKDAEEGIPLDQNPTETGSQPHEWSFTVSQ